MEEYVWITKVAQLAIFTAHVHPIMNRLAREWNVAVTFAGPIGFEDELYTQAIYEAIDRRVAGIMLHGWGVPAEIDAVNTAIARGIPVVTADCDIPNSNRLAHVGTDWFRMGSAMADQIVGLVGSSGKILYMGNMFLSNIQTGFHGFQHRMVSYPDIELIGPVDNSGIGDSIQVTGQDRSETATLEYLNRYPDINGVVGFDYSTGPGIAKALEVTGLGGQVKVVCVDAEIWQIQCIQRGTIQAAFAQRRELFTFQAFQLLYAYNHGSALTGYRPGPSNIAGNIDTGFVIVTKGNVDSFADEFRLDEAFEHQALTRRLALMSTVVDSSGQMTLAADNTGRIVYANPASLQLTGKTEDQIMGGAVTQMFDFTEEQRAMVEMWPTAGVPLTVETAARRRSGDTFPVQLTISPMKTGVAGGGMVLIAADITARKRVEEALRVSEARWQFALEGAGDGVWDWDVQTNQVFFSRQWKAMLGFAEHEIENTFEEWDKRLHPEDRDSAYNWLNLHLTGEIPFYFCEQRLLCKDGSYKWILDRGKVISRDEQGQPLRIIGTHTDITARKNAEEVLRKSEEYARGFQQKLQALHAVNLELIAAPSVDAMCIKVIELGRSILGFDRLGLLLFEDAEHASRYGIESDGELHVERHVAYLTKEDSVIKSGVLTSQDSIFISEDVDLRDFHEVVGRGWNVITGVWDGATNIGWLAADNFFERKPLIPYQTELLRLYGLTIGNLVVRKRIEAEMRRLNEELEQRVKWRTQQLEMANNELEAFAYSVSHDLRTPLRAIDGFSQALLEDYADRLNAEGRSYLERVRAGSQRMSQLIDDLLSLSRVTRQGMRHETVDLAALAREIAEELRVLDPGRDVAFVIAEKAPACGDPTLLRLVMQNLLTNAWKFTNRQPHAVIEFTVVTDATNGETVYSVVDNGVGFDMAYVDKLFGVFQRLHAQNEFEGTGIGLATVKRIILRHGGRVWAEGEVDKGAAVRFTLGHKL